MKKLVLVIALIVCSFPLLFACGNPNKATFEVEHRYQAMINKYKNEEAYFFGEEPYKEGKTIVIKYNDASISHRILNGSGSDDLSLMLSALGDVQANLLKYIFRYYENWNASFFENISMYDYEQKEINELYAKVENLDNALEVFKEKKKTFENEMIAVLLDGSKETVVSQFTYEYNKVIEKAIDFVEYFRDLHVKYIFSTTTNISNINAGQRQLDDAYLSLAKYVYYTNVNIYNYSTGENGVCDMTELMRNRGSQHIYINDIDGSLSMLGTNISLELSQTVFNEDLTNKLVNIEYTGALFNQALDSYLSLYENLDQYLLLRVELGLIDGVSLEDFVKNLDVDEKIAYDNAYNLENFLYPELIGIIAELES